MSQLVTAESCNNPYFWCFLAHMLTEVDNVLVLLQGQVLINVEVRKQVVVEVHLSYRLVLETLDDQFVHWQPVEL
jgi:hypothetical protein